VVFRGRRKADGKTPDLLAAEITAWKKCFGRVRIGTERGGEGKGGLKRRGHYKNRGPREGRKIAGRKVKLAGHGNG